MSHRGEGVFRVLSDKQIKMIHEKSLELLENLGVKVLHQEMTTALKNAGAVGVEDGVVKIPPKLVERSIKTAQRPIQIYDRNGEPAMRFDGTETYYGTASDTLYFRDYKTGEIHPTTVEDLRNSVILTEALPNMHYIMAGGTLELRGKDPKKTILFVVKEIMKHTTKPICFLSYDTDTHNEILDLFFRVAGGEENFRKRPFAFHYAEPIPPLSFPEDTLHKLIACAIKEVPLVFMPYCMMGGTAPITSAGALLQCNSEVLAALVMQQVIHEGAPYIYGAMPTMMDMRTTVGSYGSPELHQNVAAMREVARFYDLPFFGTAGVTDSKNLDAQAYSESMATMLFTELSKPEIVHDIGLLYHSNVISLELVVVCNEIIDMLRNVTSGIEVNEDTLSLDVIKRVGPQGNYLMEDQTYEKCREKYYPDLFDRSMEGDPPPTERRIEERIDQILRAHQPPPIDARFLEG
jgi:trimethylamine--corrinoid protein Co-methyltransferase